MSTPLLIGLIWLGLVVMFLGVLRVGTSTSAPRPGVSRTTGVIGRIAGPTTQHRRPNQSSVRRVPAPAQAA